MRKNSGSFGNNGSLSGRNKLLSQSRGTLNQGSDDSPFKKMKDL